jgi:GNAT superfamily N-acetyltransferase
MELRPLTYDDLDETKKLQPEGWPDILPEFEFYVRKKFCYPIKALLDRKMVGVGTLIVFGRTGWLAHIIVDENHRKIGIGSQITCKLINIAKNHSLETLLLMATELGLPIYKKAGFRIITAYQYYHRISPRIDFYPSLNIRSYEDSLEAEIFKLDEEISGEDRRALLTDHLGNALVYVKNDKVEGCYVPDLGEGMIIANTAAAGVELMKVKYSQADKAVLPIDNATGTDFLKQHGFALSDTRGTRMILGKDIDWKPQQVFSRIGGNYG